MKKRLFLVGLVFLISIAAGMAYWPGRPSVIDCLEQSEGVFDQKFNRPRPFPTSEITRWGEAEQASIQAFGDCVAGPPNQSAGYFPFVLHPQGNLPTNVVFHVNNQTTTSQNRYLKIWNGSRNTQNRLTSGSVKVNGVEIASNSISQTSPPAQGFRLF